MSLTNLKAATEQNQNNDDDSGAEMPEPTFVERNEEGETFRDAITFRVCVDWICAGSGTGRDPEDITSKWEGTRVKARRMVNEARESWDAEHDESISEYWDAFPAPEGYDGEMFNEENTLPGCDAEDFDTSNDDMYWTDEMDSLIPSCAPGSDEDLGRDKSTDGGEVDIQEILQIAEDTRGIGDGTMTNFKNNLMNAGYKVD